VFSDFPDAVDLGHGAAAKFVSWGEHEQAGLIDLHLNPTTGKECSGAVLFDLPGVRESFPDRALWKVESFEPLTLSPSLLCNLCGHHGWIQGGQWVPA
jgi:hypothetical protein